MVTLDVVHTVDRLPAPDEKVFGRAQQVVFGGPAANAAATAAALGVPTRLLAPFGASPMTPVVAGQLAAAGVSWVDPTPEVPHPSPVSTGIVTAGTGQRAVVAGAAPPWPTDGPAGLADVIEELLDGVGAVLVDGHAHPAAVAAARAARKRGIPVVLDGGSFKTGTVELVAGVDLAVLSAAFVAPNAEDPLDWVLEHGPRYAARSAGPGPLRVRTIDDALIRRIEPPAVEVVDTLGAGDALHGAIAAAIARVGLGPDTLVPVLRMGVEVAALSCRYAGVLGWSHDPANQTLGGPIGQAPALRKSAHRCGESTSGVGELREK